MGANPVRTPRRNWSTIFIARTRSASL